MPGQQKAEFGVPSDYKETLSDQSGRPMRNLLVGDIVVGFKYRDPVHGKIDLYTTYLVLDAPPGERILYPISHNDARWSAVPYENLVRRSADSILEDAPRLDQATGLWIAEKEQAALIYRPPSESRALQIVRETIEKNALNINPTMFEGPATAIVAAAVAVGLLIWLFGRKR